MRFLKVNLFSGDESEPEVHARPARGGQPASGELATRDAVRIVAALGQRDQIVHVKSE